MKLKNSNGKVAWVILLIVVLGLAVAFIAFRETLFTKIIHKESGQKMGKAIYYCPMHPTYTSDRPGDCLICNMKMEKREAPSLNTSQQRPQSLKDICYMHNCPMMQEGKFCPMMVVAKAGEKVTCPACGTHVAQGESTVQEKNILYWTDPMMPDFKSDKPGKSPMGMDLVPVYEEETRGVAGGPEVTGYAPILVSPQK